MTKTILSFLTAILIVLASCGNQGDESMPYFPDAPANPDPIKLIQLVNEFRAKGQVCGKQHFAPAANVVWNDTLALVAKRHSENMFQNDKLSHTDTDGTFVDDRITAAGYDYSFYAENLLKGAATEIDAIKSWKNSTAHCENLMDPNIREIGVGTAGPYWTMVLASH